MPTLIQRYDKEKKIIFNPVKKNRDSLKFYRLSDATVYDCINTIYINLLNLSGIKKRIFFRNMEILRGLDTLGRFSMLTHLRRIDPST